MSYIVLDTSVFVRDFHLRGNTLRATLVAARDLSDQVVVPAVVLDELVNKFREALEEAMQKYQGALEQVRSLLKSTPRALDTSVHDEVEKYRIWLVDKLKSEGIGELGYPRTGHKEVVQRALQRRKPFSQDGR